MIFIIVFYTLTDTVYCVYFQVVVLELQRGDQVYVELVSGRKLCKYLEYNIFTGYILYPQPSPYIIDFDF